MADNVREVMTRDPMTCPASSSLIDAARAMRDRDIGDLVVTDEQDKVCGIVTDRDLVIRGLATGEPQSMRIGDICSRELTTLSPDSTVGDAIRLMEEHALRRLPVVENDRAVGMVSIGDLAVTRDRESALGQISAAPPNK